MGHNLGFQERWEFRRKEINDDSSDDDSKSNSEQILKSQRLVVEDDYHSGNPAEIEPEMGNTGTKAAKPKGKRQRKKQQTRVTKKSKLVNDMIEHVAIKKGRRKKAKDFASDPSLMEHFKNFSESLLEDMKATGEKLFVKMKEEIFELIYSGPSKANDEICRVGCAQMQNQRSSRYGPTPSGQENIQIQGQWEMNRNQFTMNNMNQLPTGENANVVCDFPQVQHQKGFWLGRGIPNTSLNRPLFVSHGSEGMKIVNINSNINSMSSGSADRNIQDIIRQNSLSSFNSGMLPRNEASDQLQTWRAEVERMKYFKPDVPFMKDDNRQLQLIMDERVAFQGNFYGPVMLREREYDHRGRLLGLPMFSSNFSTPVASSVYSLFPEGTPSSCIRSQLINPSSNLIQNITSGSKVVMNGGSQRMKIEGSIRSAYQGMEPNPIRSIPQVGNSDRGQCNTPNK